MRSARLWLGSFNFTLSWEFLFETETNLHSLKCFRPGSECVRHSLVLLLLEMRKISFELQNGIERHCVL